MPTLRTCPSCSQPVPADAPGGFCPPCLLSHGFPRVDEPTFVPKPASRAKFTPPKPTELAPVFPQLEILEFIGAGGMGAVYRARQTGLDRQVALKVLHAEIGQDPAFAERFAREARALARLNHPHIVGVYESGRAAGYYYLVMEFVAGVTLREMIAGGKLDPATALAMTPQICEALEYAHGEGVVHRDIKPENILVDARGSVKIADFGLAKLSGRTADRAALTQPQQVMGTLHYMAPEQMRGAQGVDHRADIYSLGVVIYEMLTGELPIGRFEPPSQRVAVDVRIDEVVLRTLERDPDRRYQRAVHVKTEIDAICTTPVAGRAPASRESAPPVSRLSGRWPRVTLGVCALILTASFLPWGLSEPRTKLDHDCQFLLDNGGAVGESIYRRLGRLEYGFVPEGKRASAWSSSLGLKIIGVDAPLTVEWPVQIPNWIVPIVTAVIGVLLVYRHAGRAPPAFVVPLLSLAGGLQTVAAIVALDHRGHYEPAPFVIALGFLWCLAASLAPAVGIQRSFAPKKSRSDIVPDCRTESSIRKNRRVGDA